MKKAVRAIEAQQEKEKGHTPAWMAGEQLKDICRREPRSAELIHTDLTAGGFTLGAAAAKIKALADERHKKEKGSCIVITPEEAEGVLRKYFGLTEAGAAQETAEPVREAKNTQISLEDYF